MNLEIWIVVLGVCGVVVVAIAAVGIVAMAVKNTDGAARPAILRAVAEVIRAIRGSK
ncbi:hypothetical protein [Streptomyces sp. NPDC127038]|uniref:hypothetical protein n=1 Tax=Streptomyces sp. NPDC127038 TaxID=3347114 RepID=UPI00365D883C